MNAKSDTVQRRKDEEVIDIVGLDNEVGKLRIEAEMLKAKNNEMRREIESSMALADQELRRKKEQISVMMTDLNNKRAQLDADRNTLDLLLKNYEQDRAGFEEEKKHIMAMHEQNQNLRVKLSNFMVLVKREADKF